MDTIRLTAVLTFALALAAVAAPARADEPVDLRPKWEAGQTATYEFWTRVERSQTTAFGDRTSTSDMTTRYDGRLRWEVTEAGEGGTTATMTLLWVKAEIAVGDADPQVIDTREASGDNEQVYAVLSAMAGKPLTITLSPDGTPTAIDGVDAVRNALAGDLEPLQPEDEELLETATGLAALPAAPADAEPGATWSTSFTWPHALGEATHDTTFTFERVSTMAGVPIAKVSATTDIELKPDREKIGDAEGVSVTMTGGTESAELLFDLDRHEMVARNSVQRSTVEIGLDTPQGRVSRTMTEAVHGQSIRVSEE